MMSRSSARDFYVVKLPLMTITCCRSYDAPRTVSRVDSLIPKFLQHQELHEEIDPELKHVFVKFRLEVFAT